MRTIVHPALSHSGSMSREVLIGFREKGNLIVRGSDNLVKTSGLQLVHVHLKERVQADSWACWTSESAVPNRPVRS
jgi:hypothetical protein